MNSLTPYEILIAQKVEQLPVPEMADSIWVDIEQELDAGPSPADGSSGTPPANNLPGIGKGFYLFTVAVIGITLVWIYTGNRNDAPKKVKQPEIFHKQETPEPITDSSQLNEIPVERNNPPLQPDFDKNDSVGTNNLIDTSTNNEVKNWYDDIDSLTNTALTDTKDDSVAAGINTIVEAVIDSSAIRPPVKKPKGVKGLRDNDYKIKIGKNDSLKKGD